jgi:pyruvate formate lyase activating enzyme
MLDWEDRLSSVIVLQGCNFRCPFCHSAEFVPPGPPGREVPWEEVEEHLARNEGWIDGVVVSGGEPTIHAGLGALLEKVGALGLPVKLDTNGAEPERLRELVRAGLVRHVALDVKAALDEADYARAVGRGSGAGALGEVRESLDYLRGAPVSYELRTTCVPGLLGEAEEEKLLELARDLTWARAWYLQAFRPVGCLDPEFEKLPETNPDWLESVAAKCRELAPGCRARGHA